MTVTTRTRLRHLRDSVHFTVLRAHETMMDHLDERPLSLPRPGRRTSLAVAVLAAGALLVVLAPARAYVLNPSGVFEGTPRGDLLEGTVANEQLIGLAGDDVLLGNGGDDVLHGGAGADHLDGGEGDDKLYAGPGASRDVLVGGPGNDVLQATANDGIVDTLLCGPGDDVAHVLAINGKVIDRTVDCERIVVTDVRTSRKHGDRGRRAGR